MPNWSLLMIIAILIAMLSVAIFYARITEGTDGELHEIERKIYKKNNPQFPRLTENQTLLMEALAYHANFQESCKSGLDLQAGLPARWKLKPV